MTLEEAKGWALIIGAISAGLLPLLTLIVARKVHTLVNSAMTEQKTENGILRSMLLVRDMALADAEKARAVLAAGTTAPPPGPLEVSVVQPVASPVPVIIAP